MIPPLPPSSPPPAPASSPPPTTPSSSPPPSAMEGAKKRSRAPDPEQVPPHGVKTKIRGLHPIFDPNSFEWMEMSTLLPVLKHVYEEAENAPGETEQLYDWIDVSECASCLIKFLSRRDLIEECDKLPSRIARLKEACRDSSYDYTPLIRYAERIYADAAELCERGYNVLKDDREETTEGLPVQTEIEFANLSLIRYQRQLREVNVRQTQEQGPQFVLTLERSTRQVEELKRRIGLIEQLQQVLLAELDGLRREEAEAEKELKDTQGKVSDIPFYAYQEQRRQLLRRAKALSLLEPGPTPLSLASESVTSD